MNTPYKESKAQRVWFRYGNANGEKWGKHHKPINYHICVWHNGRYISCDCYTYLSNARKVRDKLQALNPQMNYIIIGNYGNEKFQALEKG